MYAFIRLTCSSIFHFVRWLLFAVMTLFLSSRSYLFLCSSAWLWIALFVRLSFIRNNFSFFRIAVFSSIWTFFASDLSLQPFQINSNIRRTHSNNEQGAYKKMALTNKRRIWEKKNGDTPKWLSGLNDFEYKCINVSRWVSGVVMNRHENVHNEWNNRFGRRIWKIPIVQFCDASEEILSGFC